MVKYFVTKLVAETPPRPPLRRAYTRTDNAGEAIPFSSRRRRRFYFLFEVFDSYARRARPVRSFSSAWTKQASAISSSSTTRAATRAGRWSFFSCSVRASSSSSRGVFCVFFFFFLFFSLVVYFLRYKEIGGRIFKIQKNTSTLQKKKKEDMRAKRVPFAFALLSCSAFFLSSSDARLYGSYSRTGGTRKPSGIRFSSRLAYNAYGRKLLQEERGTLQEMQNFVEPVATCPENNTMYNVLKTTPELSR